MFGSDRKIKIAFLSIASNTILILFKVIAGILSGSVSIISEAIHSGMDLIASFVAFLSVRTSAKPPDQKHPYGHGKVENISGFIEGILIFVAAALIIYEAVKKIVEPAEIGETTIAMVVMFISAFINMLVSKKLYKVSQEEDSMALEADALHLKTDVYTAAGVGIGILLMKLTGLYILDPIVAIIVALMIIKEAWELCKNAWDSLLDSKLSDDEEREIEKILSRHRDQFIDFHKLKTRKSGNIKHIDFHITVPYDLTVQESHDIIASIKKDMNVSLKNTRVSIHVDPYKKTQE
jgi:cation diffusion facilitator family transporter